MAALVQQLEGLGRPVVDKTGLKGLSQFKTILPPPAISPAMRAILGDKVNDDPSGVSITRSLEQLGLQLQPNDARIDVIVVDKNRAADPRLSTAGHLRSFSAFSTSKR